MNEAIEPIDAEVDKTNHQGRKLLSLVFKTIIWGTLVDLFHSTVGVLWKYVRHLLLCLHYFWSPDIDRPPFSTFDFKKFCKHSFEAVLLILLISIFSVKVGWLAPANEYLKEELGNDLFQMGYEAGMFALFAITYFISIILSIATGRIIRNWLTPEVSRKESDILMITFFNSFLTITAVTALTLRIFVRFQDNELDAILSGMFIILFLTCLLLTIIWAFRFVQLNSVKGWKAFLFFLLSIVVYTILFSIGGFITTGLLYIV